MSFNSPLVTVLMPVYNGSKYLGEAIRSIINQTFTDFEFLIIDDGSTDYSLEIIKSFDDKRIRLVENEKNLGQSATLNKGINLAVGKYIARMDQDDISINLRLEQQINLIDGDENLGLVSTGFRLINSRGEFESNPIWNKLMNSAEVELELFLGNPIAHPSVMFRKVVVQEIGGYNETIKYHCEDYNLWHKLAESHLLAIVPEPLVYIRKHLDNATAIADKRHLNAAQMSIHRCICDKLQIATSQKAVSILVDSTLVDRCGSGDVRLAILLLIRIYIYVKNRHLVNTEDSLNSRVVNKLLLISQSCLNKTPRTIIGTLAYSYLKMPSILFQNNNFRSLIKRSIVIHLSFLFIFLIVI